MATIPRACSFLLVVFALAVPAAATAQLPDPPPAPTLPLPLPPVPALPLEPPAVQPPAVPVTPSPAPVPAVTAPSVAQQSAPSVTAPATAAAATGASPSATQQSPVTTPSERRTARRRPAILLGFRSALSGRVRITVTQVSPVCRTVGRLVVNAREGRNRVRFAGRIDGRRLRDGTYVAETPSGDVRFAIVRGRPTRNADRFAPSVCRAAASSPDSSVFATHRTSTPGQPPTASGVAGAESGVDVGVIPDALPRVVGTSAERVAEAALSLHPVFYLLLGFAIAALAAATVPSRAVPAPAVGALLARRRAEITLVGSLALLAVLASYWVALISG